MEQQIVNFVGNSVAGDADVALASSGPTMGRPNLTGGVCGPLIGTSLAVRRVVPRIARCRSSIGLISLTCLGACGLLPISRTSLAGTDVLQTVPKPAPLDSEFDGCGDAGSQPDYTLNRLKNRIDDGEYVPVPWTMIARLPWPRRVGYRFRNQWTSGETDDVRRFEGAAVEVEGYLVAYKLEIPEPPNCYSLAERHRDFHLWLSERDGGDKRRSIVIEITPRVRLSHPNWTEQRLAAIVAAQVPLRARGWLMLDQMHPENVGRNRVTLWEVHPILHLDWRSPNGEWVSLDSLSPAAGSQRRARAK